MLVVLQWCFFGCFLHPHCTSICTPNRFFKSFFNKNRGCENVVLQWCCSVVFGVLRQYFGGGIKKAEKRVFIRLSAGIFKAIQCPFTQNSHHLCAMGLVIKPKLKKMHISFCFPFHAHKYLNPLSALRSKQCFSRPQSAHFVLAPILMDNCHPSKERRISLDGWLRCNME